MTCNANHQTVFWEAIFHCRWKTTLNNELKKIDVKNYENSTFEEVFSAIHRQLNPINRLGPLAIYDVSSGICRENKIEIEKIHLIGGGPKNAIKLLGMTPKSYKIDGVKLFYVEVGELTRVLKEKNIKFKDTNDGDYFETFICLWQKENKSKAPEKHLKNFYDFIKK
jgi:hypothetical protein